MKCTCGGGLVSFNVHRGSSVYTPQTVVIVNPPSQERIKRLNDSGGGARALSWALNGFQARRAEDVGLTLESLVEELVAKGLSESMARNMARQAADGGELLSSPEIVDLPAQQRAQATAEAITIAMAVDQSREKATDLLAESGMGNVGNTTPGYRQTLDDAGLEDVELIQRFPVLTGHFGYTRGGGGAGEGRLRPYMRDNKYVVYSDVTETEALFFRLRPSQVVRWLNSRGYSLEASEDERSARIAFLRSSLIPNRGDDPKPGTPGTDALALVHTYAHRVIRRIAVFSGIDRNALSELVVPHHLGFFVYAAARGDFVLGGLQAVFETELDNVLRDIVRSDHRCPLDPGCQRLGGACVACLHLGEPSCRYFNRYLSRAALFGKSGFLKPAETKSR